jgi:hypothetical protein
MNFMSRDFARHESTKSNRQFADKIVFNFGAVSPATRQSVASCKYPFNLIPIYLDSEVAAGRVVVGVGEVRVPVVFGLLEVVQHLVVAPSWIAVLGSILHISYGHN